MIGIPPWVHRKPHSLVFQIQSSLDSQRSAGYSVPLLNLPRLLSSGTKCLLEEEQPHASGPPGSPLWLLLLLDSLAGGPGPGASLPPLPLQRHCWPRSACWAALEEGQGGGCARRTPAPGLHLLAHCPPPRPHSGAAPSTLQQTTSPTLTTVEPQDPLCHHGEPPLGTLGKCPCQQDAVSPLQPPGSSVWADRLTLRWSPQCTVNLRDHSHLCGRRTWQILQNCGLSLKNKS